VRPHRHPSACRSLAITAPQIAVKFVISPNSNSLDLLTTLAIVDNNRFPITRRHLCCHVVVPPVPTSAPSSPWDPCHRTTHLPRLAAAHTWPDCRALRHSATRTDLTPAVSSRLYLGWVVEFNLENHLKSNACDGLFLFSHIFVIFNIVG
jgi:hypothetical protein